MGTLTMTFTPEDLDIIGAWLDRELTTRGILPVPHLGEAFGGPPAAAPKITITDVEQAIDRATAVLWDALGPDIENRPAPSTVRRWATAVIDAAGAPPAAPHPGWDVTYGAEPMRARPVVEPPADPTDVNLSEYLDLRHLNEAARPVPPDQCPRCTSDRREWRFAMPGAPGLLRDAPPCSDPWHDLCGNPNPNDDGRPCTHPAGHSGDHYSHNPDGGLDTWGQARLFVKCGAPGPDGFTCQRPAGHGHDHGPDGRHAARHDSGLTRW